jgi:hypothetical protein
MPVEVILSLREIFKILEVPYRKFTLVNINSRNSGFNCMGCSNNKCVTTMSTVTLLTVRLTFNCVKLNDRLETSFTGIDVGS